MQMAETSKSSQMILLNTLLSQIQNQLKLQKESELPAFIKEQDNSLSPVTQLARLLTTDARLSIELSIEVTKILSSQSGRMNNGCYQQSNQCSVSNQVTENKSNTSLL